MYRAAVLLYILAFQVLADGYDCPPLPQPPFSPVYYPLPDDCRFFRVCVDGNHPRKLACPVGQVFNDVTLVCDAPENVPGCENYYTENFLNI